MGWSNEWGLIYIDRDTYLPLLKKVTSGQPGWYAYKWKHNDSGEFVGLLIAGADKINTSRERSEHYPHLTIDFSPNTREIVRFHYSPSMNSLERVGTEELVLLLKALYPALLKLSVDDIMSLVNKL